MAESFRLKSQKSLLTRICNNLQKIIQRCEDDTVLHKGQGDNKEIYNRRSLLVTELRSTSKLVLEQLNTFANTVDDLANSLTEEQEMQASEYLDKAHLIIERAQSLIVELEVQNALRSESDHLTERSQGQPPLPGHVEMAKATLPAIPIPKFTGKVWEYNNFWTLFEENVHNQPLTKLQKFNYLLSALRGEAREMIRRYAISEENYESAVELLRKKYGDEPQLICVLQARLESAKADRETIAAQRKLLETIIPIVTQLERLGIHLDGSYLVQKVIAKFSAKLQRKVLEKQVSQEIRERDWKLSNVLKDLDSLISMEERVNQMVDRNIGHSAYEEEDQQWQSAGQSTPKTTPCIFCDATDHRAVDCRIYDTIDKRRRLMQEKLLCLNCGGNDHYARNCGRGGCKICQGKKHHFTLCPKRFAIMEVQERPEENNNRQQTSRQAPSQMPKADGMKQQRSKNQQHPIKATVAKGLDIAEGGEEPTTGLDIAEGGEELTGIFHMEKRSAFSGEGPVLLLTGCAKIYNLVDREWTEVEVLFDTGADRSFINLSLADKLNLKSLGRESFQIYTFGSHEAKSTVCEIKQLNLKDNEGKRHTLRLYATPVLTGKGKRVNLCSEDLEFLEARQIPLSALNTREPNPQILLGCDQLWKFLEVSAPKLTLPSGLILIPSKLGYLITGKQQNNSLKSSGKKDGNSSPTIQALTSSCEYNEDREKWDNYWTMDSSGICEFSGTKNEEKAINQKKVKEFFNSTIEKRADGYYVRLPVKESHPPLPTNKAIATKRLVNILQSLKSKSDLLEKYDGIIKEQFHQNIIEEVTSDSIHEGKRIHYIPHQPVITPLKETTKLRIVFDASSHFKNSPSLNDVLYQGPSILPKLYEMLIRFRTAKYVATADVEKAFLQVHLNEGDRDVTRFLWVRDIDLPPEENNVITYRFTRVTFGLNVSPYLLAGTIRYHVQNYVSDNELAKDLRDNLYVDNLILPARTEEELQRKAQTSRQCFKDMGMNLRQFLSNSGKLSKVLEEDACATTPKQKVLGITWDSEKDNLSIKCMIPSVETVTKRKISRNIASIYDPLGWLVPILTKLKKFQQDLWKQPLQWDDPIQNHLCKEWKTLRKNADGYEKTVPRNLTTGSQAYSIAVFADASKIAMAVCAYLMNEDFSSLIMARSKLPSINTHTTIPKMELNALTMAVRLANSVSQATNRSNNTFSRTIIILSDSQVALNWLTMDPYQDKAGVLVRNRINEIHEIVNTLRGEDICVYFKHVTTEENPADLGTRGTDAQGMDSELWWHGPHFLRLPLEAWTNSSYNLYQAEKKLDSAVLATRAKQTLEHDGQESPWDLSRYSTWKKAKRTVAVALIFVKKLLRALQRRQPEKTLENIPELEDTQTLPLPISSQTMCAARRAIIRYHQRNHLTDEYRKSMENTLRPFLDHQLIWRSKERLDFSSLSYESKNPIIIAPKTTLAKLIIEDSHGMYHKGVEHTMSSVRSQYWIPHLRRMVRHFIHDCVRCRRFNGLPYHYPDSSNLPERRVQKGRPFQHIGVDFFDLPSVKDRETRIYGCIFTCTSTRLIHLEVVTSMCTEDFLNALRRFIARRGVPESITCDNAPTFLLSEQILNNAVARETSELEIIWHHIIPYAPWQGGLYERLIKSIKQAFYKATRGIIMQSHDHLVTLITEIEACLNSRPLTYQAAERDTIEVIRPIDFLQKDWIVTLPFDDLASTADDPDYVSLEERRAFQTRHQVEEALQSSYKIAERFWKIWQKLYLTSLREKHLKNIVKKRQGADIPKIGSVVLVNDPVLPRNSWKLARIIELHRGIDGEVREAELISNKRRIKRPINLLVPLEIEDNLNQ